MSNLLMTWFLTEQVRRIQNDPQVRRRSHSRAICKMAAARIAVMSPTEKVERATRKAYFRAMDHMGAELQHSENKKDRARSRRECHKKVEKHSAQTVEAARATLAKAANSVGSLFPDRRTSGTGLDKTRPNRDAEKTLSDRDQVTGREQKKAPVGTAKRGGLNGKPASEVTDTGDSVSDADLGDAGDTAYKMFLSQDDHGQYRSDGKGETLTRPAKSESKQRSPAWRPGNLPATATPTTKSVSVHMPITAWKK